MINDTHWQAQYIMSRGKYRQMEFVAPGASSDVYRAVDSWTEGIVAIKVLRNPTPDKICRFRREGEMYSEYLDNPYVVNILDSDLDGVAPYLVLEYAELGSLQECVANRRDWRTIAKWLYQITYGLTMVHERGGIIRDIKPANLLRFRNERRSGVVKITDLGLGQRSDRPSGTTSPLGTIGYIDPAAQMTGKFTPASDIYSLGVTMAELLTGSRELRNPIPGPPEFQSLIRSMNAFEPSVKDFNVDRRPTARQICERTEYILRTYETPAARKTGGNGLWWGLGLTAVAVIAANSNAWDSDAGRYRDSSGRFRSGWLS
jgi:serine/threonine protein kinase